MEPLYEIWEYFINTCKGPPDQLLMHLKGRCKNCVFNRNSYQNHILIKNTFLAKAKTLCVCVCVCVRACVRVHAIFGDTINKSKITCILKVTLLL